jgi:tetratricopeptide (TPR) repeat protein
MLLGEQERVEEAELAFRKAFRADPALAAAAYNLSVILANDQIDEALEWGRKAAELRPDNPQYAYTLAYFLRQKGETDEAISVLQGILRQTPGFGDAYGLLGNIYEESGKREEAKALYQQALETDELPAQIKSFLMGRLKALSSD